MSIDTVPQTAKFNKSPVIAYFVVTVLLVGAAPLVAQETTLSDGDDVEATPLADENRRERPRLPPPQDAKPLFKDDNYRAWVDAERGVVLIDGEVSLRAGGLEMFACTRNTKEHESVVVVDTQAFPIHAALLALGGEPGGPVQFQPEFVPPSGTEIEIHVEWRDDKGIQQTARAQDWIRDFKTHETMQHPWVFAGSLFATDPDTGRQYYQAEWGDFICVSNFPTAMLDVPIESTQANEGLYFEANTEVIPPLGTPVRLVLKPVLDKPETEKPKIDEPTRPQ